MNRIVLVSLGVLAALGIGGFVMMQGFRVSEKVKVDTGENMTAPAGSNPTSTQSTTVSSEESKLATVNLIEVSGDEYSFSPETISLKKGEKYRITFKNVGKAPHDLVIPDLKVKTAVISGGEEISVEVTPEKTGTFTFYCSVGNHQALGMEGSAEVEQ